ncbi:MAG: helix-turn-helix transcriptional regulator [Clostridia bacterium]|nr:helix-turn-helix transcriptional regulator [Clostridia bacterium]
MKQQFAGTLKQLRKARGVTQSELAAAFSVSSQSVSRWENGQSYPDIEQFPMIADYFGVTLDELMGRTAPANSEDELRRILREEDTTNINVRRKIRELYGEFAHADPEHYAINYFRESAYLRREGFCWESDVEDARELCRQMLETCSGDRLPTRLVTILMHEDEDKLAVWQPYITNDYNLAAWDDLLLMRYFVSSSDAWKKQRQTVLHRTLEKAIYLLANDIPLPDGQSQRYNSYVFGGLHDVPHYRRILALIDLFSTVTDDLFLRERIYTEIRLAAALAASGNADNAAALLTTVLDHLRQLFDARREKMRGSVPQLALIEEERPRYSVTNAADDILVTAKRHEFDSVRGDERLCELIAFAESIRNAEEWDEFPGLIQSAREKAKELHLSGITDGTEVIVLRTDGGREYTAVIHDPIAEDDSEENALMDSLRENGDTRITRIVCIVAENGGLEMISYRMMEKFARLNRENRNAEIILAGKTGTHIRRLEEICTKLFQ